MPPEGDKIRASVLDDRDRLLSVKPACRDNRALEDRLEGYRSDGRQHIDLRVALDPRLDDMHVGDAAVAQPGGDMREQGVRIAVMHLVEGVVRADPHPNPVR